jgi:hypothetical protein
LIHALTATDLDHYILELIFAVLPWFTGLLA